ncbi:MAG: GMC family oxidoreductase, partial [Chloroflexota bacterium]
IVSAGVMGTLKLLFHCRDTTKSLTNLSPKLGERVRTNSEALLGATARKKDTDYSQGIAIASVFDADEVTKMEPVRYPAKSGLMRLLSWPLLDYTSGFLGRLRQIIVNTLRHPIDLLSMLVFPGWAERTTILLVMQTEDNKMNVQYGREPWSLFRKRLVIDKNNNHQIPTKIEIGHQITREFAQEINGIEASSIAEGLLGMPSTAHILGGIAMGKNIQEGVVDLDCQVFNYPGLFVIDGSIMPANPGINPSLTITALAEYAMSKQPNKST